MTQWLPVYCSHREFKLCSQDPCQAASTTCLQLQGSQPPLLASEGPALTNPYSPTDI